ncbi:MAG: c-type cytochrome [Bacteroidetes bacterium]|nr:c-type cytochrome [Bacteroidota bacterium]
MILYLLLLNGFNSYGTDDYKELFKENCASCHEIGRILTGPDLMNINSLRTTDWLIDFIGDSKKMIEEGDPIANQLYEEYQRIEMPPAGLSKNEILGILDYIENFEVVKPVYQPYTVQEINKTRFKPTTSLIALSALLLLLLLYLLGSPLLRKRLPMSFYIITISFFGLAFSMSVSKNRTKHLVAKEQHIAQPLEFSHKVHYTDYQIDCIYCHEKALNYATANLPLLSNCMKCHDYIREGESFEKKEIDKLIKLWEQEKDIAWVKGYRLSEHVHFDHGLHTQTAGLKCTDCHVNIEIPSITKTNVSMKWCLACHEKQSVNLLLNYYKNVYDTIYNFSGLISSLNGSSNCFCCHY